MPTDVTAFDVTAFGPPCPCGSGTTYDACCGRLHRGAAQARTPEELMRSRYAAFALDHLDHVVRTWAVSACRWPSRAVSGACDGKAPAQRRAVARRVLAT